MILPPALRPGGRVALTAPAGPLADGAVARAAERIRAWGWEPVIGGFAHGRHGYLSGTDDERVGDLNAALRAADNDAIWFLRGGYGTMRILDRIDWDALIDRPRPVIGFSDNTAIHLTLQRRGLVSFHGPHPASPELTSFAEAGVRQAITSTEPLGLVPFPPDGASRAETLVAGVAEGRLVGGNLSLLAATLGTPFAVDAREALLFLEEVGEPVYRLDRLLSQLRLSGVLEGVAGVVVGAISECPDQDRHDLPPPLEVLLDRLGAVGVPVAFGFPFGHIPDNWTVPCGVRARLDASAGTLEILGAGVS